MKQSSLAQMAGVSASYLNLIEHNKRNAGDQIQSTLAKALGVSVEMLREGGESSLLADLREAAAQHAAQNPETHRLEELAGRFPGWSQLIATQGRQMRDQAASVAALTDRLNYDPHLQKTLHEMLTNITAIRSTAGILTTEADLQDDQLSRFQNTIHDESIRLSEAAGALVAYLDRAEETPKDAATPQEVFEQFLERHDHVFPQLDKSPTPETVAAIMANLDRNTAEEARTRISARLETYRTDALSMPFAEFLDVARRTGFSPQELGRHFDVSMLSVFRRLASLARKNLEAPRFGLVIINAAGHPLFRRPLQEFSLPRFGSICALWPVFQALSVPDRPIEQVLSMPDGSAFLARAVALPGIVGGFGNVPHYQAGMLVTGLNDAYSWGMVPRSAAYDAQKVGTSCRLCQRGDCAVRSEPSLLPEVENE